MRRGGHRGCLRCPLVRVVTAVVGSLVLVLLFYRGCIALTPSVTPRRL